MGLAHLFGNFFVVSRLFVMRQKSGVDRSEPILAAFSRGGLVVTAGFLCACTSSFPEPNTKPNEPSSRTTTQETNPPELTDPGGGPKLKPTDPLPPGAGCTFERIQTTVRTRLGAVTQCYRNEVQNNPSLAGKVKVELGIERGGKLVRRSIFESQMPTNVNACIIEALEGLEFSGDFNEPCVIIYPFVFSASTRTQH